MAEGSRLYHVAYDIPNFPEMNGHVHTIPAAALANYRIDTSEVDPMVAMDYYLREAMTSLQTSIAAKTMRAMSDDDPRVMAVKAQQVVRTRLEQDIFELAGEAPGDSPEEIQEAVEEVVVSPVARLSGARALSVPAAATAASRLDTAQQAFAGVLSRTVAASAVDTSLKPWATLAQMVADDTAELDRERAQWFDARYGERIRLKAGMRFRGTR
jgi:hypothetical protein